MKTRLAAVGLALGAVLLLGLTSASSQVRFGFGIHIGAPPPPVGYTEVIVERPYPGAVWVRGCWSWNGYEHRRIWIPGHWASRHYGPIYRERAYRHVPHGVARGWWRKHGGEWRDGHGRGRGRGYDND